MERVYTINLSKVYSLGKHTVRARRAIKEVRRFAARHMKSELEKVVIGTDVNEAIWRDGIQKPPRKLRVKLVKDDKTGTVMVMLESQTTSKSTLEKKPQKKSSTKEKTKPKTSASSETPAVVQSKV